MYASFAPLGTISLRLLGVPLNTVYSDFFVGGLFPLNTTLVKPLQPSKTLPPILLTELGIVTLVKLLQPLKDSYPILKTELGIVTLVKLLQSQKANSPILVTELGMVTLVKLLQP